MTIPIITIHYGYAPYLLYTLAQARVSNPQSPIILLGDSSNAFISFFTHQNAADYSRGASEFEQLYQGNHASPNYYQYELICF